MRNSIQPSATNDRENRKAQPSYLFANRSQIQSRINQKPARNEVERSPGAKNLKMSNVYEGHLLGEGLKFGIVVSRFNSFVTEKLLAGALDALKRHGVDLDDVDVFWTPGAFEIPGIAKRLAESERYDAVVCLGAVIRGATPHFDYVAAESAKGIANISFSTNIPVIYGVITTDTIEQALERAGIKAGNKGSEAAIAGIETANLYKAIDKL